MFPANLTLQETSEVVRAHNALHDMKLFIEADRGDHVIFNYLVSTPVTFPALAGDAIVDRAALILRECRGIIFDNATGQCISRRFHKFFNLGQVAETQVNVIDWSQPHVIMDKLDGSMIAPFRVRGGERRWGTKMGATDVAIPVEAHVKSLPQYEEFALMCEAAGFTPLFEWTSRQQRIVIDYPEDRLVLLHVRNIVTGEYATREQVNELAVSYNIPAVDVLDTSIDDIDAFVAMTRGLQNAEGYVVQFVNSRVNPEMLKLKADEYCLLHNTKEKLNLEKNVIAIVLDESFDDLLPQLDAVDRVAVERFLADIMKGAKDEATVMSNLAASLRDGIDLSDAREAKKQYASRVNDASRRPVHDFEKGMLFKGFNLDVNMLDEVLRIIKDNTNSSSQVERIRPLIGGIKWSDYRGVFDGEA